VDDRRRRSSSVSVLPNSRYRPHQSANMAQQKHDKQQLPLLTRVAHRRALVLDTCCSAAVGHVIIHHSYKNVDITVTQLVKMSLNGRISAEPAGTDIAFFFRPVRDAITCRIADCRDIFVLRERHPIYSAWVWCPALVVGEELFREHPYRNRIEHQLSG
jgi:hypothetical protein